MNLSLIKMNNLAFYTRPDTSDVKSLEELILKNEYEKSYFKILPEENWLDFGAYIGGFSCLALSRGARIIAFEPDPNSFQLLQQNIILNDFDKNHYTLHNAAVTIVDEKRRFYRHPKNAHWRNSLYKHYKSDQETFEVLCLDYRKFLQNDICIKMDIEGAELDILESLSPKSHIKKLVFEYSFDIDSSLDRYRSIVEHLKTCFQNVHARKIHPQHKIWQRSWFPPCTTIFCYN